MRTQPSTLPPPVTKRPDDRFMSQTRQYRLVTPLFGGGVVPAEADPVMVIRGTEIRGHLRFWWRACRGGQSNGDLQAMKETEDRLWGASSTEARPRPSLVQVSVVIDSEGTSDMPFEVVPGRGNKPKTTPRAASIVPPYAAFPLQPGRDEATVGMQTKAVRLGVSFTLTIAYPKELQAEVEAALWAWENFGGLGARTRRGFGTLCCTQIDGQAVPLPETGQVEAVIRQGLQKHVVNGKWPHGVAHLSRNVQFKITPGTDALSAWRALIDRLRRFRQARNPGSQPKRRGRSQWPEPDAIRRLTGRKARLHADALSTTDKFPRAVFGLPVIFHFKDEATGDPFDTTLKGTSSERLASPLILRPITCAKNRAVGLALVLESPYIPPDGLILKGAPGDPRVRADLTLAEAKKIKPLNGQTDVFQAFLKTL
jgi:CRISPR-associated protein Cmr1